MTLGQHLYQKQQLKLTPQQLLLQRLLPLSAFALEEKIKNEVEENPALEIDTPSQENSEESENINTDNDLAIDKDFWQDDGDEDTSNYTPELGDIQPFETKIEKSCLDILSEQLYILNLNKQEEQIAQHLIGSLDPNGYLTTSIPSIQDDLLFKYNKDFSDQEIIAVLKKIQQLDPPGIGARNLQECLLLQLKKQKTEGYHVDEAICIVEKYFDYLSTKNFNKLCHFLHINEPILKMIIDHIETLHPYPLNTTSFYTKNTIYPDFIITQKDGEIESYANGSYNPKLKLSKYYEKILQQYKSKKQKDAELFIKQKIEQAQFFIEALQQRKHTLQHILNSIITLQKNYFLSGDETQLQPMLLKNMAQTTNNDISTISRAIQHKYVQTDWGIKPLKFFFNEQIINKSGELFLSIEIETILQQIIDQEDKKNPYTDEELEQEFLNRGKKIARRSIGNYRQKMNIPTAQLRKKL
ncbi:MAG: RNA polymerase factor sigma-54 [Chitinophagaceae bacterium]